MLWIIRSCSAYYRTNSISKYLCVGLWLCWGGHRGHSHVRDNKLLCSIGLLPIWCKHWQPQRVQCWPTLRHPTRQQQTHLACKVSTTPPYCSSQDTDMLAFAQGGLTSICLFMYVCIYLFFWLCCLVLHCIFFKEPLFLDLIGTCHSEQLKPAILNPRHLSVYRLNLLRGLTCYSPDILSAMLEEHKLKLDDSGALQVFVCL